MANPTHAVTQKKIDLRNTALPANSAELPFLEHPGFASMR